MPILYVKTGCPYCAKVLEAGEKLNLTFDERNVADPAISDELIARGGKRQMPYLVDGDVEMYESDDIVAYLMQKYSGHGSDEDPTDPAA